MQEEITREKKTLRDMVEWEEIWNKINERFFFFFFSVAAAIYFANYLYKEGMEKERKNKKQKKKTNKKTTSIVKLLARSTFHSRRSVHNFRVAMLHARFKNDRIELEKKKKINSNLRSDLNTNSLKNI